MSISGISQNKPPKAAQGMDPNAYAQNYATQNGISLNEAKEQLKAKYGDPQKAGGVNSASIFTNTTSTQQGPKKVGDPEPHKENSQVSFDFSNEAPNGMSKTGNLLMDILSIFKGGPKNEGDPLQGMDPDARAQKYADENGITLKEAKEELKAKYGEPKALNLQG